MSPWPLLKFRTDGNELSEDLVRLCALPLWRTLRDCAVYMEGADTETDALAPRGADAMVAARTLAGEAHAALWESVRG